MPARALILGGLLALLVVVGATLFSMDVGPRESSHPAQPQQLHRVAALGRLEPRNGIIRVAGPPRTAVVIKELTVAEGDWVTNGQIIAILLGIAVQRAELARLDAELENANEELTRNQELFRKGSLSESELRSFELATNVAAAALQRAQAELQLSMVRAPIDGQVLEIHAREGERVDEFGILELGDTSVMYAVAEVYETDIGRVQVGQLLGLRSATAVPQPVEADSICDL